MIIGYDGDSTQSIQGVGTYTNNLVQALVQMDNLLKMEAFDYADFYKKMPFSTKIKKYWLRKSRKTSGDCYWEWNVLPEFGEQKGIDLYHSMGGCVPKKSRFKTVQTIHDLAFYYYEDYLPPKTVNFFKTYYKESAESADALIAISESTKKDIIKFWNISAEKIFIVHHGVSKEFSVRLGQDTISNCINRHNISSDYFLFVGELNYRKNIHTLLDAFARFNKENNSTKLVLVGKPQEGEYYSEIKHRIKTLNLDGNVIITGRVPREDLFALYQGATAFVFPTLYEGFGLPILEAMASGVPVISSNNSSIPEIAKGAALLVDALDVNELSGAMLEIISDADLRQSMTIKGRDIAENHTWENTAIKTFKIYTKLLHG